ncbi:hypothetical protein IWX78_001410 [Mycetocola sp. CAN_C7]|uniref:NIPSNAP family protein n=1 Tax=Mycetocola sp. CAN_C7 TaxID=2787724 RepID=UPI0018C8F8BE
MLVEERTYVLHTEVRLADYMASYENVGLPRQKAILGGFLGYFVTEFGVQNELTHFWAYEDLEQRRERRALLAQDAAWLECLAVIRPMIRTMENKIMYPTGFSPIRTLPVASSDEGTAFNWSA